MKLLMILAELMFLPMIAAQWVGVVGLGKGRRDIAWHCMMIGVCSSTFFGVIRLFSLIYGMAGFSPFSTLSQLAPGLMWAWYSATTLGPLMFFIGFALHGMRTAKSRQRASELAAIAAARGDGNEHLPDPYDTTR